MSEIFYRYKNIFFSKTLIILLITLLTACSEGGFLSETVPNPTASVPPTYTSESLPDLSIKEVGYEQDPKDLCSTDTRGGEIYLIIQNSGSAVSGDFSVVLNNNKQLVNSSINPNGEIKMNFPGSDYAVVRIDSDNNVEESNEANNSTRVGLNIPQQPAHCLQTPTPEADTLSSTLVLEGHKSGVLSVDFSPDGDLLASGSIDNTLRLWTVEDGSLLRTMFGHPFPILDLKFTPNGSFIITGSTDGLGRVWRVSDGKLINTLEGHSGWINSLDVSKDGGLIATCADDYTVRVWRMFDAKEIQNIDEGMSIISDISFSPNNDTLVWSERNGVIRIRSIEGFWIQKFNENDIPASSVAVSPDGNVVISGHFNGDIKIWDINKGEVLHTLKGHTGEVTSLSISPNGNRLASGAIDGISRVWNIDSLQSEPYLEYILQGHEGSVNDITFSPQGSLIATASNDGTIRFWQVPEF